MGDKDITQKTLEVFNDVFADIVNGLLFKGKAVIKADDLVDAQPFSMYKAGGKIHAQERDGAKFWMTPASSRGGIRLAMLAVEYQTDYDRDMPIRFIGYDGAGYRAELSKKERYPVITIVLYFGDKPWGKNRSLYDVLDIPEEFMPYVNDYRINLFEIAHLPEEAIQYFHSDFRIVADYFVHSRVNPAYRPKDPVKFRHTDEVLKMLSALTRDNRFVEVLEEGGKPKNMCEVLDRVEARGLKKGIRKGVRKGIRKGIRKGVRKGIRKGVRKGVEEGKLESIRSIMQTMELSVPEAMDALLIPESDRPRYTERL